MAECWPLSGHVCQSKGERSKEDKMQPRTLALTVLLLAVLVGFSLPGGIAAPAIVSAAPPEQMSHFSQEELIQDARQLADILENTHPDPYIRGGGRIAFHRRLQQLLNNIPEDGMTRDEFARLLRPFVAAIGDGHTRLLDIYDVNDLFPGGVPFLFMVVEESLYVAGVPGEEYRDLIGSLLVSVEGVPLTELCQRQTQLRGTENQYHVLYLLATESLWYGPYLADLLPEWEDPSQITVELQLPGGEIQAFDFALPMSVLTGVTPDTQITLPTTDDSGFLYDFLDLERQVAYLRIDHMQGFREMYERRGRAEAQNSPSATETFRDLVIDMHEASTEMLIVDLRRNRGGHSVMSDILAYFLYGKDALLSLKGAAYAEGGGEITRLSRYYLDSTSRDISEWNEGRGLPLIEGDYDFTWDFTDDQERFQAILPYASAYLEAFAQEMPTFYTEYQSGTYEGYYLPEQVMVLVSPRTFSSGHGMARYFYLSGATLLGTPPGQAGRLFANSISLRLAHTGIDIAVSTEYYNQFPNDPDLAQVLPVHYPLTYEILASYDFDPNAEVLYALDLLPEPAE
jgi:hypothetical protein